RRGFLVAVAGGAEAGVSRDPGHGGGCVGTAPRGVGGRAGDRRVLRRRCAGLQSRSAAGARPTLRAAPGRKSGPPVPFRRHFFASPLPTLRPCSIVSERFLRPSPGIGTHTRLCPILCGGGSNVVQTDRAKVSPATRS